MTTRRTTFRLSGFLEDLQGSIAEAPDRIDDVVQTYKDFLSRTKEPLLSQVKGYINNHPLVTDNEKVRSFVVACHKLNFEK